MFLKENFLPSVAPSNLSSELSWIDRMRIFILIIYNVIYNV